MGLEQDAIFSNLGGKCNLGRRMGLVTISSNLEGVMSRPNPGCDRHIETRP